ncbi:glycosyltransferase family 4 protein [Candidatus Poribacteria bacterium]|nr:glycosyltransferase family 4 protein [Candidatus Poribacteria bacterium]
MRFNTDYRLNRHHRFKQNHRKYVADLETNDIVEVNEVEWDILERYATQTQYQIVEALKEKYKVNAIFDGIARLEQLGKHGQLLTQIPTSAKKPNTLQPIDRKPKVLVPFEFTEEKSFLDYITHLNRFHLLTALAESTALETFGFTNAANGSGNSKNLEALGEIHIRQIDDGECNTFTSAWYAREGYDGILLLSQSLTDNLLYYQIPDVPIVHCIENTQKLQNSMLETLLHLHASQKAGDTLVVKTSWMKEWLSEFGIPERHICVIPDGINVVEPIGKVLAKQHTATLFNKPMFTQHPVVGLISGFEPNQGAQWITEFAQANRHLAIFVYDAVLSQHYKNPPDNVVIFGADSQEMASILPVFFQALDLVCFPTMPGTPFSVVLEAMAYGVPCIAMTKYGMPPEFSGAGMSVECQWDNFGNFHVPMRKLSAAINAGLVHSDMRTAFEGVAKRFPQKYTWQKTAQKLIQLFEKSQFLETGTHQTGANLFPPIFCRRYNPHTFETTSDAYRLGINRYEHLEKALGETLLTQHKTTEVASVFKHFKTKTSLATSTQFRTSGGFQGTAWDPDDIDESGERLERFQIQQPLVRIDESSLSKDISSNEVVRAGAA